MNWDSQLLPSFSPFSSSSFHLLSFPFPPKEKYCLNIASEFTLIGTIEQQSIWTSDRLSNTTKNKIHFE